jgi:hypothetical protein
MKRFFTTILFVSVFFIGLGSLIEKAGAKFKSDEKALALIRAARQAIGGDSAIAGVQSLRIVGQTTQTVSINGAAQTEQGETEIALQLPDKLMKMVKIGHGDESGEPIKLVNKQVDVVVRSNKDGSVTVTDQDSAPETSGVKTIIVKKADGNVQEVNTAEGRKIILRQAEGSGNIQWKTADRDAENVVITGAAADPNGKRMLVRSGGGEPHDNELLRTTLALLLSAPKGMDVSYTFGGESDVDGTACNVVVADFAGSVVKLFLNRDSNLPVMISYFGTRMPKAITFERQTAAPADGSGNVYFFKKTGPGPDDGPGDKAEFQVRFSDYRSVNGVQLPYHWTTNVNGTLDETFDVTTYEVNSPDVAAKFQKGTVLLRTKKPEGQ